MEGRVYPRCGGLRSSPASPSQARGCGPRGRPSSLRSLLFPPSSNSAQVGKSQFISTLTRQKYEANISTNGIAISNLAVDLQDGDLQGEQTEEVTTVNFKIFDFGGQAVFYPTHQFFLTNDSIFLLLFKATEVGTARLEYWLKTIGSLASAGRVRPQVPVQFMSFCSMRL